MARELSWQFDMNRTNTGSGSAGERAAYVGWYTYAFLTGKVGGATGSALWTVAGSSNGSTSGLDTTERLGTAFTASNWVSSTNVTGSHTWYALQAPTQENGQNVYLIFDYVGTNSSSAGFYFARGSLGEGSLITGSVKQRPTGSLNNGTVMATQTLTDNTNTNHKVHGAIANNGMCAIHSSKDATSRFWFGLIAGWTTDNEPNNPWKFFVNTSYRDVYDIWSVNETNTRGLGGSSGITGVGAISLYNNSPINNGIYPIHSTIGSFSGGGYNTIISYAGPSWSNTTNNISDPYTGNSQYLRLPIYLIDGASNVVNNNNANFRWRGRIPDIFWCHHNRSDGDVTPNGSIEYMAVGMIWVPTNASPNL